ncbi:amino acid adenylation domain-containing protein [Sphingomonas sp. LHG3443-2]|uniref:amino acid adenylation domain-containing protein n=1 Tax=Sphingomonas sp. LHG3443-2 TaxID=2804639 RepID=UPI003CF536F1
MPDDLGSLIADVARGQASRPALWAKGELLTYGELHGRATRIAAALIAAGVGPGDRVAILAERSTFPYAAIFGVLLAGGAYVPLNIRFPADRNRQIVERSGAAVLIASDAQAALAGQVLGDGADVPLLTEADLLAHPLLEPASSIAAGKLAYVFFTSGTTGVPKGVPITHDNVLAYLRGIRTVCEITPDDRVMQVVDLTFDLSVHDIFLAWTAGACLYSIPENGTLLCTRFVEEHGGTHWLSVPSAAALVRQTGLLTPGSMPTLKYSFFCGEALPGAVAESWAAAAPSSAILNIYGPTEATVAFSAFRYTSGQAEPPPVVSLGEPFPEQRMGLFSDAGEPVEKGGTGEICLSGSQVSEGYWNAPEITAERFFSHDGQRWYRTGDLGSYVEGEGYVYLGRADRQVKIRGYRVELQEIENAVRKATGCDLAAVIPWPLGEGGAALGCKAYVVGGPVPDTVQSRLSELLPDYMMPSTVEAISEMPLNANGKIDHRALAQALLAKKPAGPSA